MPRRLHVLRLTSVGAVAEGDNPEAEILFYKSKHSEPLEGHNYGGGPVDTTELDLSSLDDDTKAAVEAHVADADAQVAKLEDTIVELEAKVPVEEKDELPDDLPEAVAKRFADQEERVAKAEAVAAAAEAKVEKAEDQRLTEKYMKRAIELAAVLGDPETFGPVLKDLASSESFPVLDAQLETLREMEAFEKLLHEFGDNAAGGSAVDQITAYAAEIRKANTDLTPAAARRQAWTEHPELKTQSREEGD